MLTDTDFVKYFSIWSMAAEASVSNLDEQDQYWFWGMDK